MSNLPTAQVGKMIISSWSCDRQYNTALEKFFYRFLLFLQRTAERGQYRLCGYGHSADGGKRLELLARQAVNLLHVGIGNSRCDRCDACTHFQR